MRVPRGSTTLGTRFEAESPARLPLHFHKRSIPAARRGRLARSSPPDRGTEKLPPLITWPNFDFWRTATAHERRKAIGTYYGCATHVDGTIGALLASLEALSESAGPPTLVLYRVLWSTVLLSLTVDRRASPDLVAGLSSSTAVIVHGDHGYSLGRHGRWSKYSLYATAHYPPPTSHGS